MSLYVVEGIDYSGKGSVLDELEKKCPDLDFTQSPSPEMRSIKWQVDNRFDPDMRMQYYLTGSIVVSQMSQDSDVIVDRYYYTTFVYEAIRTGQSIKTLSEKYRTFLDLIREPDKVFFLTVSPEEQKNRINRDRIRGFSDRMSLDDNLREKILIGYEEFQDDDWVIIDTSQRTIPEVAGVLWRHLND